MTRRVGERFQFARFLGRISFPIVAETASGVATHGDFEMHENRAAEEPEFGVFEGEWE